MTNVAGELVTAVVVVCVCVVPDLGVFHRLCIQHRSSKSTKTIHVVNHHRFFVPDVNLQQLEVTQPGRACMGPTQLGRLGASETTRSLGVLLWGTIYR